jgi:SAM-dependent MidA family methyltransferase
MNPLSSTRPNLPEPDPSARAHSERVVAHIRAAMQSAGGAIDFARYMDLALYAPGLGYYSAGSRKLGRDGDFTTAPEISPLFGQAIARQLAPLIAGGLDEIMEIGAGSGALAATLLEALEYAGHLPARFTILELSADLRERSRDTLAARVPHLLERVSWLNQLPPAFEGVIIGNEVLDAMPIELFTVGAGGVHERGVSWDERSGAFTWIDRAPSAVLRDRVGTIGLAAPYASEIGFIAEGFIASIAQCLRRGVALFIDYGFPAREFFHPDRATGTLMCHYRHRAHADPFLWPGLQDITAHVDFSAIASAAQRGGLTLAGYTSQASFLINCGLVDLLRDVPATDAARYLPLANAVQQLTSPAEMGELFKAIALTRDWDEPLLGFARGDRRAAL